MFLLSHYPLSVFVGYSAIVPKVKDLVPVLVTCFEEFVPAIQAGPLLDAQSFDCMMCLLQSIDLSIRFFLHFTGEGNLESQPSQRGLDVNVWDESISTISKVLSKRLLVLFPLDPVLQYSGKVIQVFG
jgi:pre-rRNA-processing protein IPI1